ncbi:ABC transporter permease [Luteimonas sp. MC1750]|uniref:ABC transporter permease n=1 Tax=Luteimonas sp. MC1750 TaxID=2799326 RepID=UPI0018F09447|nr:ABC transporter permease [Luteimonas sp. MC1750]MBJ6984958.1 ABC transporter permease [Luteimonas sp. MC1750]QQO05632.1 ABC transporter permease [Luteimonas sp. MC1750]
MNTLAHATPATGRHSLLRARLLEAKYEFLGLLRTPIFALLTLLFPLMFYLLFGVAMNRGGNVGQYLLATYGVFGVMGAALFGFGVTVAMDRDHGLLALKRALPVPPGAYLMSKMAMALLFSAIVSLLLAVTASTLAGVSLAPGQWLGLWLVHVAGALPFCAIGLYIGTLASGSAAPVVVNLVYLPLSFLSGLWLPLSALPDALARLAPVWPSYHHAQLALKVVGMDAGQPVAMHVGVLLVVTIGFFVLAHARLSRRG